MMTSRTANQHVSSGIDDVFGSDGIKREANSESSIYDLIRGFGELQSQVTRVPTQTEIEGTL